MHRRLTRILAVLALSYAAGCSGQIDLNGTEGTQGLNIEADAAGDRARWYDVNVDQAFQFQSAQTGESELLVSWEILPGAYLYRDKISFATDAPGVQVVVPDYPPAEIRTDEFFGEQPVYQQPRLELKAQVAGGNAGEMAEVRVRYQGCSPVLCYPPTTRIMSFRLAGTPADGAALPILNEADRITRQLATQAPWLVLVTFFGFGLLLSFTPCVFPMFPILSGIIVGQGTAHLTPRRGFTLSAVYVGSMAVAFTLAGLVAALFGHNLQATLQHPVALSLFAAVFVALALSMFGLYKLQPPAALTNRLSEFSRSQKGGTLTGVAIMGFASAIIVGPCVAPPLAGALAYIGQTGDPVLGAGALFTMALGMGAPLLLLGASAGSLLPRAGHWMLTVQYAFGVIMLGVALWFVARIVPGPVTLGLAGLLLVGTAIYLGALEAHAHDAPGWHRLRKGVGLAALCYGMLLIIGAAAGGDDVLQPLKPLTVGARGDDGVERESLFTRVYTVSELDAMLASAAAAGRPVLLDFYADWCVDCLRMERRTFADPSVQSALANYVLLQADVTDNNADDRELLAQYGLPAPPGTVFYDAGGQERRGMMLFGFEGVDEFLARIAPLQAAPTPRALPETAAN